MKKNVRIGLMAGLLLAPGAVVAQANEAAEGQAAVPFNTIASITEQDRILDIFSRVNEASTGTDIARVYEIFQTLTAAERAAVADELAVIEAKVVYLNTMYKLITEARDLKTKIDALQVSSPTFLTDITDVNNRYDQLNYAVNLAQTDFKMIFHASTSVRKGDLVASLLYYDQTEEENEQFVLQYVPNLDAYKKAAQLAEKPTAFIETYLEDLQTLQQSTYEADIAAARAAFNQLSADEKAVLSAHLVSGKAVTAYLTEAEATVTNIRKVNSTYNEVRQLLSPTATVFTQKVTALRNAVQAVDERYHDFFEPSISEIEGYTEVVEIMDGIKSIAATPAVEVAAKIAALQARYDALSAVFKGYVSNGGDLIQARTDLTKAQYADSLVAAITNDNVNATLSKAIEYYKSLTAAQKKMMVEESVLLAWEKGTNSAGLVVNNISKIKLEPNITFVNSVKTARVAFDKLGNPVIDGQPFEPTREQRLVGNYPWLVQLAKYENFVAQYVTLNSNNINYSTEVPRLAALLKTIEYDATAISTAQQQELNAFVKKMADSLATAQTNIDRAANITNLITALQSSTLPPEQLLLKMEEARSLYNDKTYLTSEAKKLVKNLHILTELEAAYKTTVKVTTEINKLKSSYHSKTLAKKIRAATTNYRNLSEDERRLVYNAPLLQVLQPVEQFMAGVESLKTTSPTYREQVTDLTNQYQALVRTLTMDNNEALREMLNKYYWVKLNDAVTNVEAARQVIDLITKLSVVTGQAAIQYIEQIEAAYKRLKTDQRRLVTNYKDFQSIQSQYKNSTKVINLVQALPTLTAQNAKSFATKFISAQTAFNKLTDREKTYVYNQDVFNRYGNAVPIILDIENLKVTDSAYKSKVESLKARYEALSTPEKSYVVNYSKLDQAQNAQAVAEQVMAMIREAVPTADQYIAKLRAARAAYDVLSKDEKKLVTNLKDLTDREKAVKPIIQLDEQIEMLPTYAQANTFISKYNSAYKAYEKLTLQQRALLTNAAILTTDLPPVFEVVQMIQSIRGASKTFVEDVKEAREAYNQLSTTNQARVMNYKDLVKHELNVDGGKQVDELIRSIKDTEPSAYIAKVKEVRTAYNQLSAENKRAVSLYDVLVAEEKFIKPAEQAIDSINQLARATTNISNVYTKTKRLLDSLSNEQLALVSNLHLFTNLDSVMRVIELIEKIKPSDKYYIGNTQAAKLAYDKLSVPDRAKVSNVTKLEEAVANIAVLDVVIQNIASLSASSSTYFDDVARVATLYKSLPTSLRKQVTNYADLQKAEKDVDAAQRVMKQIDAIDPTLRTFESKTKAARTAYNKLTADQQRLVANIFVLMDYESELGL